MEKVVYDIIDMAFKCRMLKANHIYGNFNSTHEIYGVLKEELDEFFDEVKNKPENTNKQNLINELIDIASVAIRAAKEIENDQVKWL